MKSSGVIETRDRVRAAHVREFGYFCNNCRRHRPAEDFRNVNRCPRRCIACERHVTAKAKARRAT